MNLKRISLSVVVLIGLQAIGSAQVSAGSLIDSLKASRSRLPAFAAIYKESLRVPNNKGESPDDVSNGQRVRLSWGDRNTDWLYEYAFGSEGSYARMIGDVTDPTLNGKGSTDLVLNDQYLRSISDGHQGTISKRKPGLINPAGSGYEIRMGEPVVEYLRKYPPTLVENSTLRSKDDYQTVSFTLVDLNGQTVVQSIRSIHDSGNSETSTVKEWQQYKTVNVPKVVEIERKKNNVLFQTITYSLVEVLPKPEKFLAWHGWKQNAIVKDNATQVVYKYVDGKLVLHPLFNKSTGITTTVLRVLALLGSVLLALWIIKMVTGRRHKSTSQSEK